MDLADTMKAVNHTFQDVSYQFKRLPGSSILLRYIKNSYQNDPIRSIVELCLLLFAVRYLLAPRYSTKQKPVDLTEREIDELVEEWTPEPLVSPLTELEALEEERRPIITGPTGPKVKLLNSGRTVTNMASMNYYNLINNDLVKERAVQILRNYGVGACGPPNFYGTQDVHMDTEKEIARFLGVPAVIVYAQSFSTISSVIPAFSKRGDIIVADRACNFAIQRGIQISRSIIRWYNHNDMEDLERVLAQVQREQKRKPLTRRFIVTEGLFETTGTISDLPKLVELKLKYKYRLILDETHSFGILGRTGRGLTEHQNVDPSNVEMLVGSLAHTLCAGGGFCAGSNEVVEHQRISSGSYVFSAALPAMLSVAAAECLKLIEGNPDLLLTLRDYTKTMRSQLERSEHIIVTSAPENPRILFTVKGYEHDERVMAEVVDEALTAGVLISRAKKVADSSKEWQYGPEVVMVTPSVGHTKKDLEAAGSVIRKAVGKVMSRRK
ncbi:PLP-dependent transferase [Ascodesmis nigricans]|uniref:serine C-palmitoyltransferase n=1 Tax=Ascodesmis nigricans TaxID=341454 RepID=A0A4S2N7H6_9PEZI|nr:PLP-dependent transferase [Ascodesmis nigricans]